MGEGGSYLWAPDPSQGLKDSLILCHFVCVEKVVAVFHFRFIIGKTAY